VTSVGIDRALVLGERIAAVRASMEGNIQRLESSRSRMEFIRHQLRTARSRRERAQDAAHARLEARLAATRVIEQAKGILMAQTGCSPTEALLMLRRASQRSSLSVSELAAGIVDRAVAPGPGSRLAVG
jgi:ANTAR domain-containing protein